MTWPAADIRLFELINGLHHPAADTLMFYVTARFTWIPLYAYLIWLFYRQFGRNSWVFLIFAAMIILLSDQTATLFKEGVARLRPSHTPELNAHIHLVNQYQGGMFGFYSAHASNSAALSVFVLRLLKNVKITGVILAVYLLLVCYSRIYLGVHFPLDIAAGLLAGSVYGFLGAKAASVSYNRLNQIKL